MKRKSQIVAVYAIAIGVISSFVVGWLPELFGPDIRGMGLMLAVSFGVYRGVYVYANEVSAKKQRWSWKQAVAGFGAGLIGALTSKVAFTALYAGLVSALACGWFTSAPFETLIKNRGLCLFVYVMD